MAAAMLSLTVLGAGPVVADHIDCTDLSKCCSDPKGSQDYALCIGYIGAVADVMSHGEYVSGFRSCMPKDISVPELRQVVLDFLAAEHAHAPAPDERHPAAGTIAEAFARTWPCD